MRKRKRRVNVPAILLAALLAFSSAGMTAFADIPAEVPVEEVVTGEEEVSDIAGEEFADAALEPEESEAAVEEEDSEAVSEEAGEAVSEAAEETEEVEKAEETEEAEKAEETEETETVEETEEAKEIEEIGETSPEISETIEEIEAETVREEKLEAVDINFKEGASFPDNTVGTSYSHGNYNYLTSTAGLSGNVTYKKDGGVSWLSVDPATGAIKGTPTEVYMGTDRTITITVTEKANTSNSKTKTLPVGMTFMPPAQREPISGIQFSIYPSSALKLYVGQSLPSFGSISTNNSFCTAYIKWQYRNVGEDTWKDAGGKVEDKRVYRILVGSRHSLAVTGNLSADNANQSTDFDESTNCSLRVGSMTGAPTTYHLDVIKVSRVSGTGSSLLEAVSQEFLPTINYTYDEEPAGAANISVGTGKGYFQVDYENETCTDNGGSGMFLYLKVTPASGYAFDKLVDANGEPWNEDELFGTRSGNQLTLKYYLGNGAAPCRNMTLHFVKAPESISLPSTKTLKRFETVKLDAEVTPSDCTLPITWSSNNEVVASVDENGVVTANAVGSAVIKAEITIGSLTVSEICTVYVTNPTTHINYFANTSKGVVLGWDAVPGATEYVVARQIVGDDSTSESVGSGITANSFTAPLDGLVSGALYQYEVYALKDGVPLCDASDAWYYVGTTTMNAPTCTAKGLRVTWPKVEGAQKYTVFRHIGGGTPVWKYLTTVAATDAATQVYETKSTAGLVPGEWYAYTVRAMGEMDTYGGQPAGRSVRYREAVKTTKLQSISTGVRATFTSVAAGYTYGLYRAPVTNGTTGSYTLVATVTNSSVGQPVWITDTGAVNGKGYSYYVRCLSKDKKVPLSSYANKMSITYKKP